MMSAVSQRVVDLKDFIEKHPVRSAFGFWILMLVVLVFFGGFLFILNVPHLVQISIIELLILVIAVLFLLFLHWWEKAGLVSTLRKEDRILFLLPLVIAFIPFTDSIKIFAPSKILMFALFALIIGCSEEVYFRGLILPALIPIGRLKAVIISALMFGLPHLLNALGGIWDPLFTVVDTIAAIGIGISFAALLIRTGSIWPLIFIHSLIDFDSFITQGGIEVAQQTGEQLALTAIVGVVLMVYGLYLMRPTSNQDAANDSKQFI